MQAGDFLNSTNVEMLMLRELSVYFAHGIMFDVCRLNTAISNDRDIGIFISDLQELSFAFSSFVRINFKSLHLTMTCILFAFAVKAANFNDQQFC